MREKSKVLQTLLRLQSEVTEAMTYIPNSNKLEITCFLDTLINDIGKMYDAIEHKEDRKNGNKIEDA